MKTFRNIEELVSTLNRERQLLKELFLKRKSGPYRRDYALEFTDHKEERISQLIDRGVLREHNKCLELEDTFLRFFEDVLGINEEINVSSVHEYIERLNENIEYYLQETRERRKQEYYREVHRCLRTIAHSTIRNVIDLKRMVESTYKNEDNYVLKKKKLERLDEKRNNISSLIHKAEDIIEHEQLTFFKVAMDVEMTDLVYEVKRDLGDAAHSLIDIAGQIIKYLNLIDYQSQGLEKLRKLKYLKDLLVLEEHTDICRVLERKDHVWMEPRPKYHTYLSIDTLRTSEDAYEFIRKMAKTHQVLRSGPKNIAGAIPSHYLEQQSEQLEDIDLETLYRDFLQCDTHLFDFVMHYPYRQETAQDEKLTYFCRLASQYIDSLRFDDHHARSGQVQYPLIYKK